MRNTIRLSTLLLVLAVFLGACLPSAPTQGNQVQNTPVDIQAQVETAVAQTIQAQNQIGTSVAQTIQAQITLTPTFTETLTPSITPLVLQTSTPQASSGGGGGGGGGGGVKPAKTPSQYSCAVVLEFPGDGTVFKPHKEFDISWTVKNTGTKTWDPTWYFEYFKGTNFSTTGPYPIGKAVKPGDTIVLELDAIAPGEGVTYDHPVTFVMQWAIKGDGSRFCTPYKAIIVSTH